MLDICHINHIQALYPKFSCIIFHSSELSSWSGVGVGNTWIIFKINYFLWDHSTKFYFGGTVLLWHCFSFFPSFRPSFLLSFLPSFRPSFLPSFLPSFFFHSSKMGRGLHSPSCLCLHCFGGSELCSSLSTFIFSWFIYMHIMCCVFAEPTSNLMPGCCTN